MKFRVFIAVVALAGLALAPSAALAQAAAKPDDSALTSKIETRLKASPSLKDDDIKVAVDNGVVTLTGTVDSAAQKLRAAQLAKVAGVKNVENKLEIDSATEKAIDKTAAKADKAGDKAAAKADKAGDKVAATSGKAADKTKNAASNAVEAITDAWITTKIKTDFIGEDALKGSDINVDTNNHVVTLKGTVASAAGRARAEAIAKTTKGVTSVVNTLTIAPPK